MQANKTCHSCGERGHSQFYCKTRRRKSINQQSEKELGYQLWKELEARPYLIERDGNACQCCGRAAHTGEKLDIEHEKGKGSHPELKRDLKNLRLYCRYPCHDNKTNNIKCLH